MSSQPTLKVLRASCVEHDYSSAWRSYEAQGYRDGDAADVKYLRLFKKCPNCGHTIVKSVRESDHG